MLRPLRTVSCDRIPYSFVVFKVQSMPHKWYTATAESLNRLPDSSSCTGQTQWDDEKIVDVPSKIEITSWPKPTNVQGLAARCNAEFPGGLRVLLITRRLIIVSVKKKRRGDQKQPREVSFCAHWLAALPLQSHVALSRSWCSH